MGNTFGSDDNTEETQTLVPLQPPSLIHVIVSESSESEDNSDPRIKAKEKNSEEEREKDSEEEGEEEEKKERKGSGSEEESISEEGYADEASSSSDECDIFDDPTSYDKYDRHAEWPVVVRRSSRLAGVKRARVEV